MDDMAEMIGVDATLYLTKEQYDQLKKATKLANKLDGCHWYDQHSPEDVLGAELMALIYEFGEERFYKRMLYSYKDELNVEKRDGHLREEHKILEFKPKNKDTTFGELFNAKIEEFRRRK